MKRTFLSVLAALCALAAWSGTRYVGGDISSLPLCEEAGAVYKTHEGELIADLLPWAREQGMNAMRVRVFVNPELYKEQHATDANPDLRYDPNACQDLEYILPLCRRIVDDGYALMLDFHYSDTWADPAKQWTPIEWQGLSDEQLCEMVYEYTRSTLETLALNGVVPSFIQTGNEISYGMLWGEVGSTGDRVYPSSPKGWDRFASLLREAGRACREVCPDAEIVIHTERSCSTQELTQFYTRIADAGLDYDIIGLSYYPYFHGGIDALEKSLTELGRLFPEHQVMIVETGYSYKWEVPGTTHDYSGKWAYSDAGQDAYARDLVAALERHENVTGLFWWWMEYNAYGTHLSGWYNAPLFDSTTGRATSAFRTICSFADDAGLGDVIGGEEEDTDCRFYDILGRPIADPARPGLRISRAGKFLK